MRRIMSAVAALAVSASVFTGDAAHAAPPDAQDCNTRRHGRWTAEVCADVVFMPGRNLSATGWVRSRSSAELQVRNVWLERDARKIDIADCAGDFPSRSNDDCPQKPPTTRISRAATLGHGPCRTSQDYFSLVEVWVTWPDGDTVSYRERSKELPGSSGRCL